MLLILNKAIMRKWRGREFGDHEQVKWVKRWREIMNTQVLVENGSNEVTDLSFPFVSMYATVYLFLFLETC